MRRECLPCPTGDPGQRNHSTDSIARGPMIFLDSAVSWPREKRGLASGVSPAPPPASNLAYEHARRLSWLLSRPMAGFHIAALRARRRAPAVPHLATGDRRPRRAPAPSYQSNVRCPARGSKMASRHRGKRGTPPSEAPLSTELARCGSGASVWIKDALDQQFPQWLSAHG